MDYKATLGAASLLLACAGYFPYIFDILKGKTKPHAYSWLVWCVLSAIGFGIQVTSKGGAGSWLFGMTALVSFFIFCLSLKYGEKHIVIADKISLFCAGIALLLWTVTDQPLLSVILITIVDAVGGFFPTFRKSIDKPYEETMATYALYAISLCFSLVALKDFSTVNALYPGSFVIINIAMVVFLLVRRAQIKKLNIT